MPDLITMTGKAISGAQMLALLDALEQTLDGAEWAQDIKQPANEHAAHLTDSSVRFRRQDNKFGNGIHAVFGVHKDTSKVELQAIRFNKKQHTVTQAKAWLKAHDHKSILFEPASGEGTNMDDRFATRSFGLHIKAEDIDDEGNFRGHGSVFGVLDSYDEIVARGAFVQTLARYEQEARLPKMLWQHNADEPIGVWTVMREDERGLYVEGQLALDKDHNKEVHQAREAHKLLKMRALDGLSIGYRLIKSETDEETSVRTLLEIDLWEVSLVTFPANDAARVGTVRSIRDLEVVLRDAGMSRRDAVAVASHGYSGLEPREAAPVVEPEEDYSALVEMMQEINKLARGD